jgi:hypothetical protein
MKKETWRVWLYDYALQRSGEDYIAGVSTAGRTLRLDNLIERIIGSGSEIKPETIRAIAERLNAEKLSALRQGYSVHDGLVQLSPRVEGVWHGAESFTQGRHRLTLDVTATRRLRNEIARSVKVEVLGVAPSPSRIMLVTDVCSGRTDGLVTPGDDMLIEGRNIKVVDTPQAEGCGVFLVPQTEGAPPIALTRLSGNTYTRVLARLPADLAPGAYRLRITTCYTRGSKPLKTPRTLEYDTLLQPHPK